MDGVWGSKCVARLFNLNAGRQFDDSALHGQWAPEEARRDGTFVRADLEIFHLNMIHRDDRARRRRKYEELDPDHRWQSIGYGYLTDEQGCVCRRISRSAMYDPVAQGIEVDPTLHRDLELYDLRTLRSDDRPWRRQRSRQGSIDVADLKPGAVDVERYHRRDRRVDEDDRATAAESAIAQHTQSRANARG